MSENQYPNSGALFTVAKKEKDYHADLNGTIELDGTKYYMNGKWDAEYGKSSMFLSLSEVGDEARATVYNGKLTKVLNPQSDKHPQWKGELSNGEIDWELAAWPRVGKRSGVRFLSINAQKPGEYKQSSDSENTERSEAEARNDEEEAPF